MTNDERKMIKNQSGINELEKKFLRHFAKWTDVERQTIVALVRCVNLEMNRMLNKEKAQAKE